MPPQTHDGPIQDANNVHATPVSVIILKGDNLNEDEEGSLIFVRAGITSEVLSQDESLRKFRQDVDGQVFYNGKGFMVFNPDYKPVDIIAERKGPHPHPLTRPASQRS